MDISIKSIDELDILNTKLGEMMKNVSKLSTSIDSIVFLTVDNVQKLTGWNARTVREMFNRPDFPACNYGRSIVVEIHAFIDYFSVPRRK